MPGGIGLCAGAARPLQQHAEELLLVVRHADRAAQCDLLRRVAADDRILHVEVDPPRVRPLQNLEADAFAARFGLNFPSTSASSTKSGGSRSRRSSSRFKNASHCACPSSMTFASIRPTSGSFFPLSAAATGCASGGIGPEGT
jgi:hypothetical protein